MRPGSADPAVGPAGGGTRHDATNGSHYAPRESPEKPAAKDGPCSSNGTAVTHACIPSRNDGGAMTSPLPRLSGRGVAPSSAAYYTQPGLPSPPPQQHQREQQPDVNRSVPAPITAVRGSPAPQPDSPRPPAESPSGGSSGRPSSSALPAGSGHSGRRPSATRRSTGGHPAALGACSPSASASSVLSASMASTPHLAAHRGSIGLVEPPPRPVRGTSARDPSATSAARPSAEGVTLLKPWLLPPPPVGILKHGRRRCATAGTPRGSVSYKRAPPSPSSLGASLRSGGGGGANSRSPTPLAAATLVPPRRVRFDEESLRMSGYGESSVYGDSRLGLSLAGVHLGDADGEDTPATRYGGGRYGGLGPAGVRAAALSLSSPRAGTPGGHLTPRASYRTPRGAPHVQQQQRPATQGSGGAAPAGQRLRGSGNDWGGDSEWFNEQFGISPSASGEARVPPPPPGSVAVAAASRASSSCSNSSTMAAGPTRRQYPVTPRQAAGPAAAAAGGRRGSNGTIQMPFSAPRRTMPVLLGSPIVASSPRSAAAADCLSGSLDGPADGTPTSPHTRSPPPLSIDDLRLPPPPPLAMVTTATVTATNRRTAAAVSTEEGGGSTADTSLSSVSTPSSLSPMPVLSNSERRLLRAVVKGNANSLNNCLTSGGAAAGGSDRGTRPHAAGFPRDDPEGSEGTVDGSPQLGQWSDDRPPPHGARPSLSNGYGPTRIVRSVRAPPTTAHADPNAEDYEADEATARGGPSRSYMDGELPGGVRRGSIGGSAPPRPSSAGKIVTRTPRRIVDASHVPTTTSPHRHRYQHQQHNDGPVGEPPPRTAPPTTTPTSATRRTVQPAPPPRSSPVARYASSGPGVRNGKPPTPRLSAAPSRHQPRHQPTPPALSPVLTYQNGSGPHLFHEDDEAQPRTAVPAPTPLHPGSAIPRR